MSNTLPPPIPPQAPAVYPAWRVWSKFAAFAMMLAPAPVAWVLMNANESVGTQLYGELTSKQPGFSTALGFILFAIVCCVGGAIHLLGGFEKRGWRTIVGVVLGLIFLLIEWIAVLLAACAATSSSW